MPVEVKPLFRPDVLRPLLKNFVLPESARQQIRTLQRWANLLTSEQAASLKEDELLPDFLTDIFVHLLGYPRITDNAERYAFSREHHVQVDGKFADAVLGDFTAESKDYVVAIEGKGPTDPLDRPFKSRKMSAVDQGYRYAINLPCDWIIITSMRETRLYSKGADQYTFERFRVTDLAANEAVLKRFVFLLGFPRVLPGTSRCHLDELRVASDKFDRELTKNYYVHYADMREDVYEQLCAANPSVTRHDVLSATQKTLDRILFCAFCEDRGLLPTDTIAGAFEHRDPYNPRPVWENFRGLFRSIDAGNEKLRIPAYNGGLFASDPVLDKLTVPDAVCRHFFDLGEYSYRPPHEATDVEEVDDAKRIIDVDILGHIFEQSITDLEQIRNELDGLIEPQGKEKHKTRRKKEGAFYTPAFITRYIVEQTLIAVLVDRFEELRASHHTDAKPGVKKALEEPRVYDVATLKKPQREALVELWEDWQERLATIRVLDPACGSGAFLIEAFDHLHAAYQRSNDRLEELRGHRTLFDLDRQILQNNLYGVDLNEEAIDICRLSLWIKTAERGKQLTSLDHTIRVGNSVVDDLQTHSQAFDWAAEFPEVDAAGGFDVVIGNPPYIRQEWLRDFKDHWAANYSCHSSTADIYTYFYELGVRRLRSGGRLGYITSGSWIRSAFGSGLRSYLARHAAVVSMIDFGEFQPFEGAEMIRPTITVLTKSEVRPEARVFKWLTSGRPPENLSDVIRSAPAVSTRRFGADAWEVESDAVLELRAKLSSVGIPLSRYAPRICRGVVTGLNEVFVIGAQQRQTLIDEDRSSEELIKPFIQGTHLRPWFVEHSSEFLIFTRRGINIENYPAIHNYLQSHKERLMPRPAGTPASRKWQGRKPGAYEWFEIQDTVDYWEEFEKPKIVWPDISKLPRFSMDMGRRYLGNTAFVIGAEDYFLLAVLASWASWFFISKTAQPLRLRADRWQYRLFTQYMEQVPVPNASDDDKAKLSELAQRCGQLASEAYSLQRAFRGRLLSTFVPADSENVSLNMKAEEWWNLEFKQLGLAVKQSFKLEGSPFRNPHVADEWEPYFNEKKAIVARLASQLEAAESELNDRVYGLFKLTGPEIELLRKEVEH